jgi:REP element-mobilizing transposase RayT
MEKADCPGFIVLVKEAVDMWNMRVPAYCLMTNDYHLLIQTPDAINGRADISRTVQIDSGGCRQLCLGIGQIHPRKFSGSWNGAPIG